MGLLGKVVVAKKVTGNKEEKKEAKKGEGEPDKPEEKK